MAGLVTVSSKNTWISDNCFNHDDKDGTLEDNEDEGDNYNDDDDDDDNDDAYQHQLVFRRQFLQARRE